MDKPQHDYNFKIMAFMFKIRDFFRPRKKILTEVGIQPGYHLLDYGCGPGGYIVDTASLVGKAGKIYALDIHPMAIKKVENIRLKFNLSNVKTIRSDCKTGLQDNRVDVVLLYDIFHDLTAPDKVLQELDRVLKPNGILSFSDHHLKENEIIQNAAITKYFKFSTQGEKTFTFIKKNC